MIQPGTIGLSRIGGTLGWLIARGQSLTGDPSCFTHAFVALGDGYVIQAMPSGAEIVPIDPYLKPRAAIFLHGWHDLDSEQIDILHREALGMKRTPYGWLDYLALVIRPTYRPRWLRRAIQSDRSMICSQLADELLRRCGIKLFDDGRDPSDVTPGDLHREWSYAVGAP